MGDKPEVMLQTKEGKLRPRWDGSFIVTGCPSPNAYTLALRLQSKIRSRPIVDVDRLKPFFEPDGESSHVRAGPRPSVGR